MKKRRRHNALTYRLEALVIRLRDLIRPPGKLLLEVGVREGMTVLDFGCGPGGFTLAAAVLVGRGGRVWALDIQPSALARVRRRVVRKALDNVRTIGPDQVDEVPDRSVDMVLLYDVLHIDPAPESTRKILNVVRHVLKPEGVLSVTDHHMDETSVTDAVTADGFFRPAGHVRRAFQFALVDAIEERG